MMRTRSLVLGVALLLTPLFPIGYIVAGDFLPEPTTVGPTGGDTTAIVATGRSRVVAAGLSGRQVWVASSEDSGRGWSEPQVVWDGTTPAEPQLCVDDVGALSLIFRDAGAVFESRSEDLGAEWSEARELARFDTGTLSGLRAGGNAAGSRALAWIHQPASGPAELWGLFIGWGERIRGPVQLAQASQEGEIAHPALTLGPGREVWIVWQQRDTPQAPWRDMLTRTLDGGGSWGFGGVPVAVPTPTAGDDGAREPVVAVARGETGWRVAVAWVEGLEGAEIVRVGLSTAAGAPGSWLDPPPRPGDGQCTGETMPRLCSGKAGLVAAWRCAGGQAAVASSLSTDLGEHWDSQAWVGDDPSQRAQDLALTCEGTEPGVLHVALALEPSRRREAHGSLRRPMEDALPSGEEWPLWEPALHPVDFLPARHGDRAQLASSEGDAFVGLDLDEEPSPAVNGSTAESRVDRDRPLGAVSAESPSIATGDGFFVQLLWIETDPATGDRTLRAALSPDRGGSWAPAAGPVASPTPTSPAVAGLAAAPSGSGTVVAVYADRDASGNVMKAAVSSGSHGYSWQIAGTIGTAGSSPSRPALCAALSGGQDWFFVAWNTQTEGAGQVLFSRSPGGEEWEPAQRLDDSGAAIGDPRIVCNAEGRVLVAWDDGRDPTGSQIRARCSSSSGAAGSWSEGDFRLDEGESASTPRLAAGGEGSLFASYLAPGPGGQGPHLVVRHSCGECGQWSPEVVVTSGVATPPSGHDLAAAGAGHVLVAWDENGANVYATSSADYGNLWTPPSMVGSASSGLSGADPRLRALLHEDGGAAICFVYDGGQDEPLDLRASVSDDSGITGTWTGPFGLAPHGGLGYEDYGGAPLLDAGPVAALTPSLEGWRESFLVTGWTAGEDDRPSVAASRRRLPSGRPPAVAGVGFREDQQTLSWRPIPPQGLSYYHVYRAVVWPGRVEDAHFGCQAAGMTSTSMVDPSEPDPGTALLYLVTAVGPGGEGPSGTSLEVMSCEPDPDPCY